MSLITDIKFLLKEQEIRNVKIPADLVLTNGNILLRAFHILQLDSKNSVITGLTQQEEYSYLRENRKPVYCQFKINDIKELICYELQAVQVA